ncbi:alpha/beta fold hydrolase [Hoeflea sp.]|uniref:alpha/beta fold hydrolase n=1 Tax=Hoeflea sp. TaxID=1940281 RepID=UPI003B02B2F9
MESGTLNLDIQGTAIDLAYRRRPGPLPTLLCLHGFGSTKEDYVDLTMREEFRGRDLVFWDTPGFGLSSISNPEALSIPFLVAVAQSACSALGLERFHLSGHSMGGLTALMLAEAEPDKVLSFFDIEGNVAPEDCFLSRQIIDYPAETADDFLAGFKERVGQRSEFSSALYVTALDCKVQPTSVAPIFRSMVDLSDNTNLMEIMAKLRCPRAFVYGAQNRHLSYLERLPDIGVEVIEIAESGHFPMYSNPPALWRAMAGFISRHEAQ